MSKRDFYNEKYSCKRLYTSSLFKEEFIFVLEQFGLSDRPRNILDLGGGTGEYSKMLMELGHNVVLFDFSQVAIDKALEIGVSEAICGDFNSFDFKNRKFDVVFAKGFSLLNTDSKEDFAKCFAKIKSLLKNPDGFFLYWTSTDFSERWGRSGWFNQNLNWFKIFFDRSTILFSFRLQRLLPTFINFLIGMLIPFLPMRRDLVVVGIKKNDGVENDHNY